MGFALCVLTVSSACAQNPEVSRGPGEWKSLLDASATGWRGYRQTALPAGWKVVDSALTRVGSGGDIVYGLRKMRAAPTFTIVAVSILLVVGYGIYEYFRRLTPEVPGGAPDSSG